MISITDYDAGFTDVSKLPQFTLGTGIEQDLQRIAYNIVVKNHTAFVYFARSQVAKVIDVTSLGWVSWVE